MIQCECFEGEEQYCHALCNATTRKIKICYRCTLDGLMMLIQYYDTIRYNMMQYNMPIFRWNHLNWMCSTLGFTKKKPVYSTRNRRKTPLLRQRAGSGGETSWVWRVFSWKPTPSLRPRNPGPGHCGLVDFKKWPLQSLQSFTKSNPEMSWEIRS
jgi:hypothetical protein